jgi:hypothetical protein
LASDAADTEEQRKPYSNHYKMAAPPNVANAKAQLSLDEEGDFRGPSSVLGAGSSKRLRVVRELDVSNRILEAELGEHEGFHARCALNAGGGLAVEEAIAAVPGVPPWFGPAVGAALAAVIHPVQVQLNNLDARTANCEARQVNSVASDSEDPLRGLTNVAGVVFADFPDTLLALNRLTDVQMTALLNHYGLAPGGIGEDKLHKIKKFIGLRIA